MRVIIRNKHTKSTVTNVIRDFDHTDSYSLDNENMVLELTCENCNYKAIYPLSCNEYVTIQPDEDVVFEQYADTDSCCTEV